METLARGFATALDGLDVPLTVQLSTGDADADRLADLTRMVEPHADAVVYGTHRADLETVRETIRRRQEADAAPPTA